LETFLLLADIHGNIRALKRALLSAKRVDSIVIAGDLPLTTPFSLILSFSILSKGLNREMYSKWVYGKNREKFASLQKKNTSKILKLLEKENKDVFYVSGNVDCQETEELYEDHEWFHYINDDCVKVGGYWWAGVPGSLVHIHDGFCDREITCEKMGIQCSRIAEKARGKDNLILVTHEPPTFTDKDLKAFHGKKKLYDYDFKSFGGSKHVSDLITAIKPLFAINGHYHEFPGKRIIEGIPVVNPGCLANHQFALMKKVGRKMYFTFQNTKYRGIDFINWIYSQRTN